MGCSSSNLSQVGVIDAGRIDDSIHIILTKNRGSGTYVPRAPHPLLQQKQMTIVEGPESTPAETVAHEPTTRPAPEPTGMETTLTPKTPSLLSTPLRSSVSSPIDASLSKSTAAVKFACGMRRVQSLPELPGRFLTAPAC